MSKDVVYIVASNSGFLDWDDRGVMSSGYPFWTSLEKARKYLTREIAITNAQAVKRVEKFDVWICPVTLMLGDSETVTLPEDDPEWAEYKRLQEKFKGK